MYNHNYYYGYGHMMGWGIFGAVLMVLFWVLVIFLVVRLVRRLLWGAHSHHLGGHGWRDMMTGASALHILNERYAKGEINKAEYEEKKKDLLS